MVDKAQLLKAIDELSPQSLERLGEYVEFLHYKEQNGSAWAKDFYDLFAPVRENVYESGMTSDDINQLIDEAIDEVRHEPEHQGRI